MLITNDTKAEHPSCHLSHEPDSLVRSRFFGINRHDRDYGRTANVNFNYVFMNAGARTVSYNLSNVDRQ
ncbi:hypothetical protein LIPSTDRAFT_71776 [Lipomyces starkeyi NRRL Y-11557]|uniref:Uncharacterized protein n=1 Tax=Lipomyces starkeyi NRRL Y-11557 TaxID=675824 RepID=A0A1E3Q6Y0_LIPST|nr:hypothetical protein LIPSTDRAFT_71776 [Lipomyces starkeyi NRRL Y-11557]